MVDLMLWRSNFVNLNNVCTDMLESNPLGKDKPEVLADAVSYIINHALTAGFNLTAEEKEKFKTIVKEKCSLCD